MWPFKSKVKDSEEGALLNRSLKQVGSGKNFATGYRYTPMWLSLEDSQESKFETCHDCGGSFLKEKMQEVIQNRYFSGHESSADDTTSLYYCLTHKKNYGLVYLNISGQTIVKQYYKTIPAQNVECDENGVVIVETKATENHTCERVKPTKRAGRNDYWKDY